MFQQEIHQYLTTHHFTQINLKAVLFDMDGVLFDSMKNHATAWHEAMKQYGMNLSREEAYLHEAERVLPPLILSANGKEAMKLPKKKSKTSTKRKVICLTVYLKQLPCPRPSKY